MALAIERHWPLRAWDKVLYFTPEPPMSDYLLRRVDGFRSVSLKDPGRIDAEDGVFDLVIASNVLEHVPAEQSALAEMRRVLKPSGRLVVTVPLVAGWDATYENPSIDTARDRLMHFGQVNHVRMYGRDIGDRLRAAGFDVVEHVALGADSVRYSLIPGERTLMAVPARHAPRSRRAVGGVAAGEQQDA